jgi:VanZ family protein
MRKYLDIPLTVICTCVLTAAMLWPLQGAPGPDGMDKIVHLVAFAALAFPLGRTRRIGLSLVFLSASAFGGLIELVQPHFGRSADLNDWVADCVGVLCGIALAQVYGRLRRSQP